jgi:hypothetical protein
VDNNNWFSAETVDRGRRRDPKEKKKEKKITFSKKQNLKLKTLFYICQPAGGIERHFAVGLFFPHGRCMACLHAHMLSFRQRACAPQKRLSRSQSYDCELQRQRCKFLQRHG